MKFQNTNRIFFNIIVIWLIDRKQQHKKLKYF